MAALILPSLLVLGALTLLLGVIVLASPKALRLIVGIYLVIVGIWQILNGAGLI